MFCIKIFQIGRDLTSTCHLNYNHSLSGVGSESFFMAKGVGRENLGGWSDVYILRPEVVESYFYLWRITKEPKYRAWAWEAALAIEKHCKARYGYSGLQNANSKHPVKDDLQRSFFLAETLKLRGAYDDSL